MKYKSTRGGVASIDFSQAVLMGLATDGGLLLPEEIPRVPREVLEHWRELSYVDLAYEVMTIFADDIPAEVLREIVERSYSTFSHPDVVPIVKKGKLYIMELFYGPTLAFKDVALQFLGNLFEYLLQQNNSKLNILGATSGDTGSAAIYGVKGRKNMAIFILHPHNRVSPVQQMQMTTVEDPNVFNIAIEGTFDDCQYIVKSVFGDLDFKQRYALGAVNSINWARVLAQVVYYVWAALKFDMPIRVCVPTGNFGNIFAGYIAKRMTGLIDKLILATNENDILYRFVTKGDYSVGKVVPTISPSMDIQVASNFERYLYYLYGEDPQKVASAMEEFRKTGSLSFSSEEMRKVEKDFISGFATQKETLETIKRFYQETGYVLDPHTAVGVKVALELFDERYPTVCLATAHPAKFPEAVRRAIGREPDKPEAIRALEGKKRRFVVLPADVKEVKDYIAQHAI